MGQIWFESLICIPFCSVSFRSIPFRSILFRSIPFRSFCFCSNQIHSVPFYSVPFRSIPFLLFLFQSDPFRSVLLHAPCYFTYDNQKDHHVQKKVSTSLQCYDSSRLSFLSFICKILSNYSILYVLQLISAFLVSSYMKLRFHFWGNLNTFIYGLN